MSQSRREYPTRGAYGDPTPRCQWCGKPISKSIWFDKRYCSSACSGADNYERALCGGYCFTIVSVLLTGFLLILFSQPTVGYVDIEFVGGLITIAVIGFCLGPYLIYTANDGKKLRDAEDRGRYRPKDYPDFEDRVKKAQDDEIEFG